MDAPHCLCAKRVEPKNGEHQATTSELGNSRRQIHHEIPHAAGWSHPLQTHHPPSTAMHYLYTRNRNPFDTRKDKLCRLCHKAPESSTHLGQCPIIQSLFSRIHRFGAATPNRICSALRRGDSTNTAVVDIIILAPRPEVPLLIGSRLTVLWKYTLMNWYKVDIEKKAFIKNTVWGQAIPRFAERN
jgi:hypothetical protein